MEAQRASGEGRIHTNVARFADDFHRKTCPAQSPLQGGLITDGQHVGQRAT